VIPTHLAEGHGEGAPAELPSAEPAASAAPHAPPPQPFTNDPPDPTPLRQAEQYEYTFRYERGVVELTGVRAVLYPTPIVTARRIGRFAVELWIGHELVDRVRFDFPLLGADDPRPGPRPIGEPPSMARGSFTMTLLVPAARRARSARLVDRARRTQSELPWPPAPAGLGPVAPIPAQPAGAVPPSTPSESGATPPSPSGSGATPPSSAAPAVVPPAPAHPR
jgi:hypothetical protein